MTANPAIEAAVVSDVAVLAEAMGYADACYESLLELSSILEAFRDLRDPPAWSFGISRAVERAQDLADKAKCTIGRFPGVNEVFCAK